MYIVQYMKQIVKKKGNRSSPSLSDGLLVHPPICP